MKRVILKKTSVSTCRSAKSEATLGAWRKIWPKRTICAMSMEGAQNTDTGSSSTLQSHVAMLGVTQDRLAQAVWRNSEMLQQLWSQQLQGNGGTTISSYQPQRRWTQINCWKLQLKRELLPSTDLSLTSRSCYCALDSRPLLYFFHTHGRLWQSAGYIRQAPRQLPIHHRQQVIGVLKEMEEQELLSCQPLHGCHRCSSFARRMPLFALTLTIVSSVASPPRTATHYPELMASLTHSLVHNGSPQLNYAAGTGK